MKREATKVTHHSIRTCCTVRTASVGTFDLVAPEIVCMVSKLWQLHKESDMTHPVKHFTV